MNAPEPLVSSVALEPDSESLVGTHRNQRAAKNVLVSVGTQLISWALAFFVGLYLPRYLGPNNYGRLEFAGSFVLLLDVLVPLGTSPVLIKQIARAPQDTERLVRAALVLRVGLALVLGTLTVLVVTLLGYGHVLRLLVVVMALGTGINAIGDVLVSALQGQEKMTRQSAALLVERFLFSGITLLFILLHASLPLLASVSIFTGLVSIGINLTAFGDVLRRPAQAVRDRSAPLFADIKNLVQTGLPFLGWLLFRTLYGQTDKLVLGLIASFAEVSWYGVAFRIAGAAMFFPTAISTALLPPLSALHTENKPDEFARMARQMLALVLFLGIPCGLFFFAIPDRLLALTHLPLADYGQTVPVLRIGGFATVFWFVAIALGTVVIASDGQAKMFRASVIAPFVGIPACVLFAHWTHRTMGNAAVGAIGSDALLEVYLIACYLRFAPPGCVEQGLRLFGAALFGGIGSACRFNAACFRPLWMAGPAFRERVVCWGVFGFGRTAACRP